MYFLVKHIENMQGYVSIDNNIGEIFHKSAIQLQEMKAINIICDAA